MLKSIDPALNADVLYALRAMGHGDDVIICDTNFPADSVARQTVLGKLLRIDNVTAARAARAVLSVMPLDGFVDHDRRWCVVRCPPQLVDRKPKDSTVDGGHAIERPVDGVTLDELIDLFAVVDDSGDEGRRIGVADPLAPGRSLIHD